MIPSTVATYPDKVDYSTWPVDNGGFPDMDPDWRPISGKESVAQQVARAWVTVQGEMHDRTIGADLTFRYNSGMSDVELDALRSELREQALNVEGVDDATVTVYENYDGVVTIWGIIVLSDDNGAAGYWNYVFQLTADKIPRFALLEPGAGA